jgi:uncharacterized protein (TIGR00369 family)
MSDGTVEGASRPGIAESGTAPRSRSTPERRGRWAEDPLFTYLGLEIEADAGGYSRIALRPGDRTRGGVGGSVHGGILATMVDIACMLSVASAIGPDQAMSGTAELNISYLRPALGPRVVAEGRILKKGRSLAVVDVDCSDGNGRLFAKGRVQYALRPARTADADQR